VCVTFLQFPQVRDWEWMIPGGMCGGFLHNQEKIVLKTFRKLDVQKTTFSK